MEPISEEEKAKNKERLMEVARVQEEKYAAIRKAKAAKAAAEVSEEKPLKEHSTAVNEVDLSTLESKVEEANKFLARFMKLKGFYTSNLTAGEIKNGGFETGRPMMNISEHLRGDTSNAFTRPSLDALQMQNLKPESNLIITAEELAAITAKLEGLGVPTEHTAPLCWAVARYCANTSSSPYTDPKGSFEFAGGAITRDAVFAVIREHATLRSFCRAFAPITWNQMLSNKMPPENWQAKGFTYNTRYAAFDVFDFVQNQAAIQPLEGLLRCPTEEEKIAHATHKRLALDRNRRNARFSSTDSLVTGGMFGKDVETKFNGSNNSE